MEFNLPKTLLLEAGFLCLPDNLFVASPPDLREPIGQALRLEKFEFSRLRCWISQHRIGVLIEGLTDSRAGAAKEVRGPKAAGAFDYNNLPSLAVQGFAAAQGVQYKDLVTREVDGEKYLFAIRQLSELPLEKNVARIRDIVFGALNCNARPWSSSSRFVHPPVYFTAMLDDKVCDVDLDGLKATNVTASHDGLTIKYHVLSGAQFYPQVLQQIGVVCETAERRKILETRIRSILPEGYVLRSEGLRISHLCYYKESLQPLLIKFRPDYLEIPEAVLHRYMKTHFSLLACENNRGRMMPAAIAISEKINPQSQEAALRSAELDDHFARLLKVWRNDVEKLPDKLLQLAARFDKDKILIPEPGNQLARCALWLIPRLGLEKYATDINVLISLIAEGERTQIAELLPSTGFSVVISRIGDIAAFKKLVPVLQDICDFFAGSIHAPGEVVAKVLCLALLMRNHIAGDAGELSDPARITALLRAADFRVDIFQAFSDIYPDHNLSRRAWTQAMVDDLQREPAARILGEGFLSTFELDPAGLYDAVRTWKELAATDIEAMSTLYQRLRSKVEGGQLISEEITECQIEKEIVESLAKLEKQPGINYREIFEFFARERVNIEACLMNLPPVLDDTNPEHLSRISILQRLVRQLGRLPFIVREKTGAKK